MSLLLLQISDAIRAPKSRVLLGASGALRLLPTLATALILCAVALAAVTTPSTTPRRTHTAAPRISVDVPDVPAPRLVVLLVDTPSDADAWLQTEGYVVVLDESAGEAYAAEALRDLMQSNIVFDFVDLRAER